MKITSNDIVKNELSMEGDNVHSPNHLVAVNLHLLAEHSKNTLLPHLMHEGPLPLHIGNHGPIAPHERWGMFSLEFETKDLAFLTTLLGDEDSALAVMRTLLKSPPEKQAIAYQMFKIFELLAKEDA